MSISDQLLNDLTTTLINENIKKGSITTDDLNDKIEKFDLTVDQYEHIFKAVEDAGIKIVDSYVESKDIFSEI